MHNSSRNLEPKHRHTGFSPFGSLRYLLVTWNTVVFSIILAMEHIEIEYLRTIYNYVTIT